MKRFRIYFARSAAYPAGRWQIDEWGQTLAFAYETPCEAIAALAAVFAFCATDLWAGANS